MKKSLVALLLCLVLVVLGAVALAELSDKTINIGFGTAIDSLTPFRSNTARNAPYFIQLYESLAVQNSDKEVMPYVAKSWTTEDGGFTYNIEIWDNVTDSAGNSGPGQSRGDG